MVYITSWDEFVERSVQLFRADPDSVRYFFFYTFYALLLFGCGEIEEKKRALKRKISLYDLAILEMNRRNGDYHGFLEVPINGILGSGC